MVTYSFITPHAFRRVFGLIEASICQTQDVPNSILSSVQVASTCRRDGSHDLSQRLPYYTTIVVDKVRERPWQDIYPESQSRSNIVDGCVILRMVSPPQCVGVIVRTGTFITLHLLEFSAVEKTLLHFKDNVKQKQISMRTDDSILVSSNVL